MGAGRELDGSWPGAGRELGRAGELGGNYWELIELGRSWPVAGQESAFTCLVVLHA